MFSKGQIVFSKCGRDKSKPFIVFDFDDQFLYLVDGNIRKIQKPKKKKKMHVQIVNKIDFDIKQKLDESAYLLDSDIRKALLPFKSL